ncbi:hypothetical protein [Chryseobacterium sp.]|nr:hypothetical protein [Chryseobacterium sp.]
MENYTDDELKKNAKAYRQFKWLKRFEIIFYLAFLVLIIYLVLNVIKTR